MTEEVVVQEQPQEQPQPSQIEQKALEQGWRPRDQFEGNDDDFIDAKEFVRRGELFSKIEHQNKELKAVRQALEAFKVHHGKVKEAEYARALKSLQDARKEAFRQGEHEQAFALEEKIDEIKAEKDAIVQEAQTPAVQNVNHEFSEWMTRNKWYTADAELREEADALGIGYHQKGKSPNEVLQLVEQRIKKMFPEKFSNPKASQPSKVEGSSRQGSSRAESLSMDDTERAIMRKIVSTGVMTEKEYIAELKKTRGV
jgi:hypothetical protein